MPLISHFARRVSSRPWFSRLAVAAALVASATCGDLPPNGPTAPGARGPRASLAIQPVYPQPAADAPQVTLSRVVGVLIGPNGERFEAVAIFDGDIATLVFDVILTGSSGVFQLDLQAFDQNGALAYSAHLDNVVVRAGPNTSVAQPQFVYTAPDASVTDITVTPATAQLEANGGVALTATGVDAGGAPVTPLLVEWTSRDPSIATVDPATGVVTAGTRQGSTWIVATTVTGVTDSARVDVRGVVTQIRILPAAPVVLSRGQTQTFTTELGDVAGTLLSGRTVAWSTSDPTRLTINTNTGVAQAIGLGPVTITATSEGRTATRDLTVASPVDRIDLSPASKTFASIDETQQFAATLVPRAGGSVTGIALSWSVDNAAIATISPTGLVTARANGTTTINATADGVTRTAAITVQQVAKTVTIAPRAADLQWIGATAPFTARAVDANGHDMPAGAVVWSTVHPGIASVNQSGTVTAVSNGNTTLRATAGPASDQVPVAVQQIPVRMQMSAVPPTMAVGEMAQLEAYPVDFAGVRVPGVVLWSSSSPFVVSVSSTGAIEALSSGTATILASFGSVEGGGTITVGGGAGGGGQVSGRVLNGSNQTGIVGASVTLGGSTTMTGTGGNFNLGPVPGGATFDVSASGFVSTQYFDVPSTPGITTPIGDIPLAPTSGASGGVSGTVRNAVTTAGIAGALVVARSGVNATTGPIVNQTTASGGGAYSLTLPAGTYTLTASAAAHGSATLLVVSIGDQTQTNRNPLLPPLGTGDQINIVLSWGQNPGDLDSHLFGPSSGGGQFHVFYGHSIEYGPSENTVASLDNDDTNGFGPETITIHSQTAGTYRYAVHHYSGASSIAASPATVSVYRGGTLIGVFHPPAGQGNGGGDIWVVFELNGTTLTPINTIGNSFPTGGPELRAPGSRTPSPRATIDAIRAAVSTHPKRGGD